MTESIQMSMRPMAKTCKELMGRPFSGLMIVLPGVFLIVLGVVTLVEPRILVWLVAAVLVVMGIAALLMARFMHRSRKDY